MLTLGNFPSPYQQPRRRLLGLEMGDWFSLTAVALTGSALVLLLANLLFDVWTYLACTVCLSIFVHLCFLSDRYVALPGLISFVAAVEMLLAPVLANSFPPSFHLYDMAVPLGVYLQYAIPATMALWVGLHWPISRNLEGQTRGFRTGPLSARVRWWLDVILFVSLLLATFPERFPGSLFFFVTVISSFRFFAALAWMITLTPGWKLRVAVVVAQLIVITSAQGIFYTLLQWAGFFVLVYGFRFRWRLKLAVALILALMSAVVLQYIKADYRIYLHTGSPNLVERISAMAKMARAQIVGPGEEHVPTTFGDVLVRFNQGWIVSNILYRVPNTVPYAAGDTVKDAVIYTLMPRALFPNKHEGASRVLFARFTGMRLDTSTTMGLSIIGEMYANFGYWGGVLGTFVFGSLVGLAFSIFFKLSQQNPLWWAAAPIVLLGAIEPAFNLEDISNYIVKSALVLFVFSSVIPGVRELLPRKAIWRHKEKLTSIMVPWGVPGFGLRRMRQK